MQQRTVDAPTPQVLEETVEVGRSVSHERVQQRAAEQIEDAAQSPASVVEAVRTVPRQLEVVAGGVSERHRLVTLGVCFRMFLELDPTLSSEKTSETLSCLRRCLPPLDIQNKKSEEILEFCQDLLWNHDTLLIPQKTNGVAERAVRRQLSRWCKMDHLKSGGNVRCNAILTCATCTTRWPMARQHSKKDVVRNLTDLLFLLKH